MNFVKMLIAFAPWIIFKIAANPPMLRVKIAIGISILSLLILGYKQLRKGFILPWGTLVFFLAIFIGIVLLNNVWIAMNLDILAYTTLSAIVWFSLIVGHPITLQYAREYAPKEKINSPDFIRHCKIITFVLGTSFTLHLMLVILRMYYIKVDSKIYGTISHGILVIGFLFMLLYPKWLRSRAAKKEIHHALNR